ncbi:mortality factor 4-like protein 1 [Musca domestica]|uniref:Mortality factor 4-like protein 1 n=1 Tax=Musca domestica TaxID=7370 RepID=A0A1I8MAE3_MUSDO|nr:mortality factor 4-like protein 1 [Musca domestica]
MQPKFKFAEGEKVLCFHGPLIYEAKALKSTVTKDKQLKYFVHYAGWNKNWDEWVPEHRVLKYNETNLQRQKDLQKEHDAKKEKNRKNTAKGKKGETVGANSKESGATSSGGSESRASTPSKELNTSASTNASSGRANRSKQISSATESKKDGSGREDSSKDDKDEPVVKKKRGASTSSSEKSTANTTAVSNASASGPGATSASPATLSNNNISNTTSQTNVRLDPCVESEETFLSKIEVKIKIPDELKQCLADDWDAITRQHKLLDIPAKITVQDIVDQYISFKKSAKSTNAGKELAITDVLNGVVEYFNVMLGSQLLYKFERPQYADILQQYQDIPLSKLYGSFHLLRLFVKLGSMLGYSDLDEKSMQLLLVHLHDFLKYLVKNSATFFSMSSFVNVTPEYHRHTQ